jgi:cell division protein FtsB
MAATAARRPAQRAGRRSARAGWGGIRWDRVARVSLLLVLAVVVFSYLGPATNYVRSWRAARETRAELQTLERDNASLRQQAKHLRDPQAVELEARKAGMARPGERVYVVRGLPKD